MRIKWNSARSFGSECLVPGPVWSLTTCVSFSRWFNTTVHGCHDPGHPETEVPLPPLSLENPDGPNTWPHHHCLSGPARGITVTALSSAKSWMQWFSCVSPAYHLLCRLSACCLQDWVPLQRNIQPSLFRSLLPVLRCNLSGICLFLESHIYSLTKVLVFDELEMKDKPGPLHIHFEKPD